MDVSVNCDVNGLVEALRQLGYDIAEASTPYLEHLYEVYVRQAWIEGWLSVGLFAFGLVLFVVGLSIGSRVRNWDDATIHNVLAITFVAFGAFALIGTIVTMATGGIAKILNPEYYALQDLLNHLTKLGG